MEQHLKYLFRLQNECGIQHQKKKKLFLLVAVSEENFLVQCNDSSNILGDLFACSPVRYSTTIEKITNECWTHAHIHESYCRYWSLFTGYYDVCSLTVITFVFPFLLFRMWSCSCVSGDSTCFIFVFSQKVWCHWQYGRDAFVGISSASNMIIDGAGVYSLVFSFLIF